MAANHPHMAAIAAGLIPTTRTAAVRPHVVNAFEINGVPTKLALGLHEVVQASDAPDALTPYYEQLANLAYARAPYSRAHVGLQ